MKKYDTNWPNISFKTVFLSFKNLWRHCNHSSKPCVHCDILLILYVEHFWKPEISKFIFSIMNENIVRLQISVNDSLSMTFSDTIYDLFQNVNSLIFRYVAVFVNFILERAWIAILKNHYFKVLILIALITFQNVGTVKFHHDFWFLFDKSLFYFFQFNVSLTLDCSQIKNFYCDLFSLCFIYSPINLCKCALPYQL